MTDSLLISGAKEYELPYNEGQISLFKNKVKKSNSRYIVVTLTLFLLGVIALIFSALDPSFLSESTIKSAGAIVVASSGLPVREVIKGKLWNDKVEWSWECVKEAAENKTNKENFDRLVKQLIDLINKV